jgi:lipoprotein-releasing system permease protein
VIHLITRISVIGITIITASLIILLSAFNGIESMIEKLYSDFDSDITIRSAVGKTFQAKELSLTELTSIPGIGLASRSIEEIVVLKHEEKWVNAKLIGVDSTFLEMAQLSKHIVDGSAHLEKKGQAYALIGATLLDNLGGYISENGIEEQLTIYAPKRDSKIRIGSNPFRTQPIRIAGRINYNREINTEILLLPFDFAKKTVGYTSEITAVYLDVLTGYDVDEIKNSLQTRLGDNFEVKTNYEKNELIYKTSKSEKVIVLVILLFIFVLAAFNLVASLTMLFVEKKEDVRTLIGLGANYQTIFQLFFLEGILIAGKGILYGFILGYTVCVAQQTGELITMPNSNGEAFPINISLVDGLLIFVLVAGLSLLFSYLPVRYLLNKNFRQHNQ